MKNLLITLTMISLLFTGCETESSSDLPQVDNIAEMSEDDKLTHLSFVMGPAWNDGVRLRNVFYVDEMKYGNIFHLTRKLNVDFGTNRGGASPWSESVDLRKIDQWIDQNILAITGEGQTLTEDEKKVSGQVQNIIMSQIYYGYFKSGPADDYKGRRVNRYLSILTKHQAADIRIMVDAMEYARHYINDEDFERYQNYILAEARQIRKSAIERINLGGPEGIDNALARGVSEDKLKALMDARGATGDTKLANYVERVLATLVPERETSR